MDRLDNLSIPQEDKNIIKILLNSSSPLFAIVPNGSIQIGNWSGVGYVIIDSSSGAGRFLISGGLNGGVIDRVIELISVNTCLKLALEIGVTISLICVTAACVAAFFTPAGLGLATKECIHIFYHTGAHFVRLYIERKNIVETWNKCT